ncbi:hypothetical protein P692DRAFT_20739063, partial [Suillus brevipes Sb2]
VFSAVSTSFIVAVESNLSFNLPVSNTTNAQLVHIGLVNLTTASSAPVPLASTWSSSAITIWIAYASLSMSLLAAAFGTVLGKQWLGYYKSNRYGRGSQEVSCPEQLNGCSHTSAAHKPRMEHVT